jgi:NAD(P)-dependent dehydrogenase (short-subunit alcohol dehydrogenase family)
MLPHRQSRSQLRLAHTISAALLIDTCAPLLNRGDTPRVVLFSSIFGSITTRRDLWTPWPVDTSGVLPECASYAALNMVAAAYASKYRNWRINAVCPGYGEQPPILVVYDGILGVMTKKEATYEVITQLVKMCTLGPDGETGTFTNKDGVLPW